MKRCPQCRFIYPDADEFCDFDKTLLEVADQSEIDALTTSQPLAHLSATHPPAKPIRPKAKALPLAVATGLLLGLTIFGVYFAVHRQMSRAPAEQASNNMSSQHAPVPVATPHPLLVGTPTPQETSVTSGKPSASPSKMNTTKSVMTTGPVSTNGRAAGSEAKSSGRPVIMLTSGGRLEADEVWRTKDGVWYRRDGVVTLLRKGRVKTIVNQ
jgi:hypothetical protein